MSNYYYGSFIPGKSLLFLSYKRGDVDMQLTDEIPDMLIDQAKAKEDFIDWDEHKLVDSQDTWNKVEVMLDVIEDQENQIQKLLTKVREIESHKRNLEREIRQIWISLPTSPSAKEAYLGDKK